MKRLLITVLLLSLIPVSSVFAYNFIDSYWNLNTVAVADGTAPDNYFTADGGDGITEAFSQLSYDAFTVSDVNLTTMKVVDAGLAYITAMTPVSVTVPADSEGLMRDTAATAYTLTMVWDDLTGDVDSFNPVTGAVEASYYSGTIDFYIDYNPLGLSLWNSPSFTDGYQVASVDVTSGSYTLNTSTGEGSYLLLGQFTSLLDGFWFEDGTAIDLDDYVDMGYLLAYSHGDNDPNSQNFNVIPNANPLTGFTVESDHNSSLQLAVVPEPSTVLLLGIGLVGMGVLGYRRRNKQ